MPQAKAEPKQQNRPQQKGEAGFFSIFFNLLHERSLSLTQRGHTPMVRPARKGRFVPKNRG